MYECFLSTTDKINYSKPILKEYTFCATPSPLFLIRPFIKDLEKKNKICFVNQSKIITLLKRHQQKRRIICPTDKQDKKWIDIAIATKSRFLFFNPVFNTSLPILPNPFTPTFTTIFSSLEYLKIFISCLTCSKDYIN